MKVKGTLPLIAKYLNDSEQEIYSVFGIEKSLDEEVKTIKTINNIKKEYKVGLKSTIPLVAKCLNTDEKRIIGIYDLNFYFIILKFNSNKKPTK